MNARDGFPIARRSFVVGAFLYVARANANPVGAKVPFDNWKAISHAKAQCGKKSNPCGKYFERENFSDCAHSIGHCLAAGSLTIKADPSFNPCPQGLAARNTDLVAALRKFVAQGVANVTEIGLADAIVGDIGVLDSPVRPYHAFMICKPVNLAKVPPYPVEVWAHSTARCCNAMGAQWKQWFSTPFESPTGSSCARLSH